MIIDLDGVQLDISTVPEDVRESVGELITNAYSTAVTGLKNKQEQLLGNIKDLQNQVKSAGDGATADVLRQLSETQEKLTATQNELQVANHNLQSVETKYTTAQAAADKWESEHGNLVKSQGLSEGLAKIGVSNPALLDGSRAMLMSQISQGENGDLMMGDQPLAEGLKAWGETDTGKAFIGAGSHTGGDAGGDGQGGTAEDYAKMTLDQRADFAQKNPEQASQFEQQHSAMPVPLHAQR